MNLLTKIIIPSLAVFILSAILVGSKRYALVSDVLPSRNIKIDTSLAVVEDNIYLPPPDILDKLSEKDDELAKVPVSIDPKEIIYYENRISFRKNGTESVTRKRLSDKERTLGLKLLNTKTGEARVIKVSTKITPDGVTIEAPEGYQIEIVQRPNGIRWNLWNTLYRVIAPEDTVIIKNNFPWETTVTTTRVVGGKPRKETKKVVQGFLYVPRSNYFEQEEQKDVLVKAGVEYDKKVVAQAFSTLRERGVRSKSFPDKLIADVEALSPRFFERLPLLEQGDLTEFTLEPRKTAEQVLIILGANRGNAWIHTCNRADACGWVQFTPGTYSYMRRSYPAAKLVPDFKEGAGNHINSIMAAILLHDSNLANLIKRYGKDIANDPRLEEYLAASYNGSPRWVWNSLDATLGKAVDDPEGQANGAGWTRYLRIETHGFMFKLRYLVENDLP